MRTIPAALQTHIEAEVISLAKCIKITKSDGSILRLTTHDIDLTVGGSVYFAGIPLDISAIQSTDTLSVDNANITIGLDDDRDLVLKTDFEDGLYDKAPFELFIVNWEDTTDGVIYLKRGELGDITFDDETKATVELRGLTQSLQRSVVERYSPTCRVNLGGKKCGVVNSPTRVRRHRQKVKTFDWFLIPNANITTPSIDNLGFEDDGSVANGSSGISDWTYGVGSFWKTENDFTPVGSWYLEGGNDGGPSGDGAEFTLYKDITTLALGMVNANVDTGDYTIDLAGLIAATSDAVVNVGRLYIEQLDVNGKTIKLEATDWIEPDFQVWQGIGATAFVLPGCRTIRFAIQARKNEGSNATIAFDDIQIRFWTNVMGSYGGSVFRTMRIPTLDAYETFDIANPSWDDNGAVASGGSGISSWEYDAGTWEVVASAGAFTPVTGGFFLRATSDGAALSQDIAIIDHVESGSGPQPANITAGWYFGLFDVYVGRDDAADDIVITLKFLDVEDNVLATFTNSETSGTEDAWIHRTVGGRAPTGTDYARVTVSGGTGAVFDNAQFHWIVTAFEKNPSDPETALLATSLPTYDYDNNDYTLDGSVLVQAQPLRFGITTVTDVVDARTFEATAIVQDAIRLYSGKVTWLSGNNAGKTSFIRIWDNTAKTAKLYHPLRLDIQVGDKFVYGLGCDKLIATCSAIFGNAPNFRGEPYLPGPNKVIEFLTTETS